MTPLPHTYHGYVTTESPPHLSTGNVLEDVSAESDWEHLGVQETEADDAANITIGIHLEGCIA